MALFETWENKIRDCWIGVSTSTGPTKGNLYFVFNLILVPQICFIVVDPDFAPAFLHFCCTTKTWIQIPPFQGEIVVFQSQRMPLPVFFCFFPFAFNFRGNEWKSMPSYRILCSNLKIRIFLSCFQKDTIQIIECVCFWENKCKSMPIAECFWRFHLNQSLWIDLLSLPRNQSIFFQ